MNLMPELWTIKKIMNNMKEDHVNEASAQCAYYVILSFIPFVILFLTLIQYTNIEPQQIFELLSNTIPENTKEIIIGIIREVYSKSIGTISITLIFTLFSADAGLFAFTKQLHLIYNFNENKKKSMIILRLISLFQTIVFIVLIAASLIIMVFGKPIVSSMKQYFGLMQNFTIISEIITQLILLIILFLIFILIYRFMPGHKSKFKNQIKGAAFASIALNVVSFIFSRYLDIFKGFSITYGSLTTLMLILMWTYSCFYVIFLGAEINKFYSMKEEE